MATRTYSHNTVALQHHHVASRTLPGNQVNIAVGQNISSAREAMRVSVALLADKAKVSPSTLAAYEDGSARPTAKELLTIANCLGVPVSKFFTGL